MRRPGGHRAGYAAQRLPLRPLERRQHAEPLHLYRHGQPHADRLFHPHLDRSIDDIVDDGIRIYTRNGHIVVEGTTAEVGVYDIMGRLVANIAGKTASVPVPAGVYLVKVDQQPARKVVVIR